MENITEIKKIHRQSVIYQMTSYILSYCENLESFQYVTYSFQDRCVFFNYMGEDDNCFSIHCSDLICEGFLKLGENEIVEVKSHKGLLEYVEYLFDKHNKGIYL